MRCTVRWPATLGMLAAWGMAWGAAPPPEWAKKDIKAGVIGTDTSHVPAFVGLLHSNPQWRVRVVAAFPGGSQDVPSSWDRVKEYSDGLVKNHKVELVDTIEALCEKVDAVLIESVDGRPHLAQAKPVLKAKKPLFIDKPFTAGLEDAREIVRLAKESGVPFFSCSCIRFQPEVAKLRANPGVGKLTKAQGSSQLSMEPHHPDLFWYGIHGVEALYTVMGRGCASVTRKIEGDVDTTTGKWSDGRIGIFRGVKKGDYHPLVKVWGAEGEADTGKLGYDYKGLVETIAKFFQTGEAPIDPLETLEIVEFMIAAQKSKERDGAEVSLDELRK